MAFVIDASVAAAWLLPDEASQYADAAFARLPDDEVLVPGLFWLEMRNILLVCERRGRIDAANADRALDLLLALTIRPDHAADGALLMRLARRHTLSAYDAAYLELAVRQSLPLATLDAALGRAARAEGLVLVGAS